MKDNESIIDPTIQKLLEQLSESRNELTKYMGDVDTIRTKVDQIFPSGQDFRNKWALEEKIKTVASLYSTILNIRQEFNKTIKDEIEIRRKLVTDKGDGDQVVDVRAMARMIEEQQKNDAIELKNGDGPPDLKLHSN